MNFRLDNKKIRLGLKMGIAVGVILLVAHGVFGSNGLLTLLAKRRNYNGLREQITQEQQQNQEFQKQVLQLRTNPAAIERHAREDLHMARRHEMIYILPQPASAGQPNHSPANSH